MKKIIRLGVLCPSEIALRRFMPALKDNDSVVFSGISHANGSEWLGTPDAALISAERDKAKIFVDAYGGKIFDSYSEMLNSNEIDAVYIPLPPALHFEWAKKALECGKHVMLEKPFTTSLNDTRRLIELADRRCLALHENYMFVYHSQLEWIKKKLSDGAIGDIRLIRIDFGYPFKGAGDFRYNKALGGGALLDCGGYTLKLADELLGDTSRITACQLNYKDEYEVDIYGNATLVNKDGLTAQVSFGMDNSYRCSLEIWGSKGSIYTNRILTAPVGYEPIVYIKNGNDEQEFTLPPDDTFAASIKHFIRCTEDSETRLYNYNSIKRQSAYVQSFVDLTNR